MRRIILACALVGIFGVSAQAFDGTPLPPNTAPTFKAAPLDLPTDLLAQAPPGGTASVDPLIGTWKLNLEKSTANFPLPKSSIFTVVKEGENMVSTIEAVNDQGRPTKQVILHIYDGIPHPTTGNPNYDSIAFTRIGNTLNQVRFRNGKPAEISQVIIIPGKTFTTNAEGIAANGYAYHYNYVYDRQ